MMFAGFASKLGTLAMYSLVLVLLLEPTETWAKPLIAVLSSRDALPYQQAEHGFERYLKSKRPDSEFITYTMNGNTSQIQKFIDEIKQRDADLVLAIGSLATQEAVAQFNDRPVVATLILKPKLVENAPKATAVLLEHSVSTELEWLHRIIPKARTVGVLFNPEENQQRINKAEQIARKLGLTLIAKPVESPLDLPSALKSLCRNVDVLWGISDKVSLSPQTAKKLLLESFRNRIPFIGISNGWVKAGALYALERDYENLGAQTAKLALRLLRGEPMGTMFPERPEDVVYAINMKTARHMKIDVQAQIVDAAIKVYE